MKLGSRYSILFELNRPKVSHLEFQYYFCYLEELTELIKIGIAINLIP